MSTRKLFAVPNGKFKHRSQEKNIKARCVAFTKQYKLSHGFSLFLVCENFSKLGDRTIITTKLKYFGRKKL